VSSLETALFPCLELSREKWFSPERFSMGRSACQRKSVQKEEALREVISGRWAALFPGEKALPFLINGLGKPWL